MRIWFTPTGVCTTNVGIPVSWQIGPSSSVAMSIFERMISRACEDCVRGVSEPATSDIAARTSGGKLVEVCVISSRRLAARNSICGPALFILLRFRAHAGLHPGVDSGHRTTEADHRLILAIHLTVPAYREFGTSETISSTALAGAQGFSTSEVGSTESRNQMRRSEYGKLVPCSGY